MKNIITWTLYVILILYIPKIGFSQQGNNQLTETINSFKSRIAALEKEISDLKAAKGDPRKIKSREDQLAGLKSMLAMVEGNKPAATGSPVQTEGIFSKKYKSPLTPVSLKRPVTPPAAAEGRSRFMGFMGKKIDDTTLITPGGKLIRLNKKKKELIIQPDKSRDQFQKIADEIVKTGERRNAMLEKIGADKTSFFFYPEILKACLEYDLLAETYGEVINNTISIESASNSITGIQLKRTGVGGPAEGFEIFHTDTLPADEILERKFRQLENLLNTAPSLNDFPAAPVKEFDLCNSCDTSALRKYYKDVNAWYSEFLKYDQALIVNVLYIEMIISISGRTIENLSAKQSSLLETARKKATSRLREKIEMLIAKYQNEPRFHHVLLTTSLAIERELQFLSDENITSSLGQLSITSSLGQLSIYNKVFEDYVRREMEKKNYQVVLQYSVFLSQQREMQLLGRDDGVFKPLKLFEEVLNFNRFTIDLSIDFDIEHFSGSQTPKSGENGVLVTNNLKDISGKVYVSLGRLGCKWQLFLTGQNYSNPSKEIDLFVPLKVTKGTAWVIVDGKRKEYQYTGPERAYSTLPFCRIGFCNDGNKDTAQLDLLTYDLDELSAYLTNPTTAGVEYGVRFLAAANRLYFHLGKTDANKESIKNLINQVLSTTVDLVPTGLPILDDLQKSYKGKLKSMEYQKQMTKMSKKDEVIMLFDATNMSPTLVNDKVSVDSWDNNSKENVKGTISLKIEHSPKND